MRTTLALCLVALAPAAAPAQRLQPSRYDVRIALVLLPFDFAAIGAAPGAFGGHAAPPPASTPRPRPVPMPPSLASPAGSRLPAPRPTFPQLSSLRTRSARERAAVEPPAREVATSATDIGLGSGISDLLAERLLAIGIFRLVERRELAALEGERAVTLQRARLMGARYVIAGTVTQFGTDESHVATGGGWHGILAGVGLRRRLTVVTLLARVVDVETGEIVAIVRGDGSSRKGGSLTLGGLGGGVGGIASVGSGAWRNSALGEATDRAVAQLAERLVDQRANLH